jgi:fatty acid desaturase
MSTNFLSTNQSPAQGNSPSDGQLVQPAAEAAQSSVDPNRLLSAEELNDLNTRSDVKGLLQLTGHLLILGLSGAVWGFSLAHQQWLVAVPSLVVYSCSIAAMFAPMHEGVHRTAFVNNRLNEIVAWWAALLGFYNSTFYRRYHKWHHRYTQIPDKDPELSDPKPTTFGQYWLEVSGLPWWIGKLKTHWRVALGQLDQYPFIPEAGREEVIRSTRLQLAVYAASIALSIAVGHPWFIVYWLLPLAVGQPFLRAYLLAEHTGCTLDNNSLTNTRTTLTLLPIRYLMWNMPFHAEHHLYASIPFHALPAAHEKLKPYFTRIESGYVNVNRDIIVNLGKAAW